MHVKASGRPPGSLGSPGPLLDKGADNTKRLLELSAGRGGSGNLSEDSNCSTSAESDDSNVHPTVSTGNNQNGSKKTRIAAQNARLAIKKPPSVGPSGTSAAEPARTYAQVASGGEITTTTSSTSRPNRSNRRRQGKTPRRLLKRLKTRPKRQKPIQLAVRINYHVTQGETRSLQTDLNQLEFIEKCTMERRNKYDRYRLRCTILKRNIPLLVEYLKQNDDLRLEGRRHFWSLQPEGEHFVLNHRYHFGGAQTLSYKQLRQILEEIRYRIIPKFNAEQWTKLVENSDENVPQVFKGMCTLRMFSKMALFARFEQLLSARAPVLVQYAQTLTYRSSGQAIDIRPEFNTWTIELWGATTEAKAIQLYGKLQSHLPLQPFLRGLATPVAIAPKRYHPTNRPRKSPKGGKGTTPRTGPKVATTNTLVCKHYRVLIAGEPGENPNIVGQRISEALGNDILWNGIFLYHKALAKRAYSRSRKLQFFEDVHGQPRPRTKGQAPPHVCRHCGAGHATKHCGVMVNHMGDLTIQKQLARANKDHQVTEAWLQKLQTTNTDKKLSTDEAPLLLSWTHEQISQGERALAKHLEMYGITSNAIITPRTETPKEPTLSQCNDDDAGHNVATRHHNISAVSETLTSHTNTDCPQETSGNDIPTSMRGGEDAPSATPTSSNNEAAACADEDGTMDAEDASIDDTPGEKRDNSEANDGDDDSTTTSSSPNNGGAASSNKHGATNGNENDNGEENGEVAPTPTSSPQREGNTSAGSGISPGSDTYTQNRNEETPSNDNNTNKEGASIPTSASPQSGNNTSGNDGEGISTGTETQGDADTEMPTSSNSDGDEHTSNGNNTSTPRRDTTELTSGTPYSTTSDGRPFRTPENRRPPEEYGSLVNTETATPNVCNKRVTRSMAEKDPEAAKDVQKTANWALDRQENNQD